MSLSSMVQILVHGANPNVNTDTPWIVLHSANTKLFCRRGFNMRLNATPNHLLDFFVLSVA